jgi:hypothetical protein
LVPVIVSADLVSVYTLIINVVKGILLHLVNLKSREPSRSFEELHTPQYVYISSKLMPSITA